MQREVGTESAFDKGTYRQYRLRMVESIHNIDAKSYHLFTRRCDDLPPRNIQSIGYCGAAVRCCSAIESIVWAWSSVNRADFAYIDRNQWMTNSCQQRGSLPLLLLPQPPPPLLPRPFTDRGGLQLRDLLHCRPTRVGPPFMHALTRD